MRFLLILFLSLLLLQLNAQSNYYKQFLTSDISNVEVKRHVIDPTFIEPEYDKYTNNAKSSKQNQFLRDTIILSETYNQNELIMRKSIKQVIGGLESKTQLFRYTGKQLSSQLSITINSPLSLNDIRLFKFGYYTRTPSIDTIIYYYNNNMLWRKELINMSLRDMYGSRLKKVTSYIYNTNNTLQIEQTVVVPIFLDAQIPQAIIDKLVKAKTIDINNKRSYHYNTNNLLVAKEEYDPPFNYRTTYVYNTNSEMIQEIKGNFGEIGDYEMDSIFYQLDKNKYRWNKAYDLIYNHKKQLIKVQHTTEDLEYKSNFMIDNPFNKRPYKPHYNTKVLFLFTYNNNGQLNTEEIPNKVKYTFIYTKSSKIRR